MASLDQRTSLVLKQWKYMSAHNYWCWYYKHILQESMITESPKDYSIIQSIGKCSLNMEFHKRTISVSAQLPYWTHGTVRKTQKSRKRVFDHFRSWSFRPNASQPPQRDRTIQIATQYISAPARAKICVAQTPRTWCGETSFSKQPETAP